MYKSLPMKVHEKISEKLLNTLFLEKITLSSSFIQDYINRPSFVENLNKITDNNNYSCDAVLKLCKDMISHIDKDKNIENWLYYIYQYTLSKSFPEAVVIELDRGLEDICLVYLEVLRVLCEFERKYDDDSWESIYPLELLTTSEEKELENNEEYMRFKIAYYEEYIYEMMKLNQEVLGYSSLQHISGVHYLAMYIGRQLKKIGLPIDLGRVSGAAAGHDIGKFGCKAEEAKRVPYLHYYYTDQWFKKHDIIYIRNIAINHSTWDLELENLSLESLVLIYCDFRVKSMKSKDGASQMHVYSLKEAFDIVLNKLDNVDEAKKMRYKRVYSKIKDFEDFMIDLGVEVQIDGKHIFKSERYRSKKYYSLLQGKEIIENFKYLSVKHNINLMYKFRDEASLSSLIEIARSEGDPDNLREYLNIFEEYSTYLTPKQKIITIKFLFEGLIHPEEDIRKQCAHMIGTLIAIFDEVYRKEVPEDATLESPELTSCELLDRYMSLLVYSKQDLISVHKMWLDNSITNIIKSLFENSKGHQIEEYTYTLSKYYEDNELEDKDIKIYLLNAIKYIPTSSCSNESEEILLNYIFSNLEGKDNELRLSALDTIFRLVTNLDQNTNMVIAIKTKIMEMIDYSEVPAENFLKFRIMDCLDIEKDIIEVYRKYVIKDSGKIPNMYLSNLKTATNWITKRTQIDLLLEHTIRKPESRGLHTAMHFCNILKVSASENVRNKGGKALIKIMPYLSLEQRNDIAIDLLRALEIEGYQFTRYIPNYLGELILYLQPVELDELIDDLLVKIKESSVSVVSLLLKTIGVAIENYPKYSMRFEEKDEDNKNRLNRMLTIPLNGLVHYNIKVKQIAFSVIGKDVFGSNKLRFEDKYRVFKLIAKKILTLLDENKEDKELLFLTNAAGLNHIYRFISDYKFYKGDLQIDIKDKVAFFPGTFDPFSLSHKEIVKRIRDLDFEVFLSIDEFSWSKRTQPNLIRRNIVKMSIADELGIYLLPEDIPINIVNPQDLLELRKKFPGSDVHIVAGSDVLMNASAYTREKKENSIHSFSHIIFERGSLDNHSDEKDKDLEGIIKNISGNIIKLSLLEEFESISSTQIRKYIDENRDISKLVDPLVKRFIHEKGLYRKEPQYKTMLQTKSISIEIENRFTTDLINELAEVIPIEKELALRKLVEFSEKLTPRALIVRNIKNKGEIIGYSIFHWIRSSMLLKEFGDSNTSDYIRNNYVGRIIMIDGIFTNKNIEFDNIEQMILTETLTFCLAKDYTYGVFKSMVENYCSQKFYEILELQGFSKVPSSNDSEAPYVVDMTNPCTLSLDIETIIKEPFINNINVQKVIERTRKDYKGL